MAEAETPTFVMQSARHALASGFRHLEQQVAAVEQAVHENPGLAFDLSRSIIEGACRTILSERDVSYELTDTLPQLYRKVTRSIPLLPTEESQATELRQSLEKTINGLSTSIQGISELRNRSGFASHGSSERRPSMEWIQAWMAAEAADTIVGFLCLLHLQDRAAPPTSGPQYAQSEEFNEWIDESHELVDILGSEFAPSAVLFEMEPETYRVHLADFGGQADTAETAVSGPES